jgi:hypothetical protein
LGVLAKRKFTTVGYYPEHIASDAIPDKRYDMLKKTMGRGFSPLDAIQAWVDIISAGISPQRVSVLGINGGDLAGFEYRLGLALGASVGVIAGSNRAADALLEDAAWVKLATPLGLINDPMTLRAFVNPGESGLSEKKLEVLARTIHTIYCKADPATLNPRILKANGQPWDNLATTFKNASLSQASYMSEILRTENYALVPVKGNRKADNSHIKFSISEIDRMAQKEHGRWNIERLREGWKSGKRNDAKKLHDCLVPWDCLREDIRSYDRNAVNSWPSLFESVGIEIQKVKSRK